MDNLKLKILCPLILSGITLSGNAVHAEKWVTYGTRTVGTDQVLSQVDLDSILREGDITIHNTRLVWRDEGRSFQFYVAEKMNCRLKTYQITPTKWRTIQTKEAAMQRRLKYVCRE